MDTEGLECQYFNFSSAHIVSGIKQTLDITVEAVLESTEKKLVSRFPVEQVKEASQKFRDAYNLKWAESKLEIKEIVGEVVDIKNHLFDVNEELVRVNLEDETNRLMFELEQAKRRSLALGSLQQRLICLLKRLSGAEQMVSHLCQLNAEDKNLYEHQQQLNDHLVKEIENLSINDMEHPL